MIPKVIKRKISTRIDYVLNNQYFADTKKEKSYAFEINYKNLNEEVQILRNIPGVPLGFTSKIIFNWFEFLNQNNQKNILCFLEFYKVIVLFSIISVRSYSCERAFLKLSMVKSKLCSTIT